MIARTGGHLAPRIDPDQSEANQQPDVRKHCQTHGYRIAAEYMLNDFSAYRASRRKRSSRQGPMSALLKSRCWCAGTATASNVAAACGYSSSYPRTIDGQAEAASDAFRAAVSSLPDVSAILTRAGGRAATSGLAIRGHCDDRL